MKYHINMDNVLTKYKNNILVITQLIDVQRKYLRIYIVYSVVILILGVFLILLSQLIQEGLIKAIIGYGGAFVTSLSSFSIKEFMSKKEIINNYKILKSSIELNNDDDNEQSKINDLFQNIILKKNLF